MWGVNGYHQKLELRSTEMQLTGASWGRSILYRVRPQAHG